MPRILSSVACRILHFAQCRKQWKRELRDFNARVGNRTIDKILGTNGEVTVSNNGHKLIEIVSTNTLNITNTFSRHKEIHKMPSASRGYRILVDYVLLNIQISPLINNIKVYR